MPGTNVARGFFGGNSDAPRDQIPAGQMYRITDYIPGQVASAEKRGGWDYVTPQIKPVSVQWGTESSRSEMIAVELVAGTATPSASSVSSAITAASSTLTMVVATPTANTLYILTVAQYTATAGTTAVPTSVTDTSGLAWVAITTMEDNTAGSATGRMTQYRAMKPSGLASGTITVVAAANQEFMTAQLDKITAATTGGTDGSAAIAAAYIAGGTLAGTNGLRFHGNGVQLGTIAQASNSYYAAASHIYSSGAESFSPRPSPYFTLVANYTASTGLSMTTQYRQGDFTSKVSGLGFYENPSLEELFVFMDDGSAWEFQTLDGSSGPARGGGAWYTSSENGVSTPVHVHNLFPRLTIGQVMYFYTPGDTFFGTGTSSSAVGSSDNDMCGVLYESYVLDINIGDSFLNYWLNDGSFATVLSAAWEWPGVVYAMAVLRGIILGFGSSDVWGISGTIPPDGGDWTQLPSMGNAGILDPRTVYNTGDRVYWAAPGGIYATDGGSVIDLTELGNYKNRWKEVTDGYSLFQGDWAVAGIYRGWYVVTIYRVQDDSYTTFLMSMTTNRFIEFSNIPAAYYLSKPSSMGIFDITGDEELYFGTVDGYVGAFSGMWTPEAANKNDGDGTAVEPVVETPFYRLSATQSKRIRAGRVDLDIEAASGSPYIQPSFITNPTDTSYTDSADTLAETTTERRRRFGIRRKALGVAFKLTQVGASDKTSLHGIDIEGHSMDEAR